ncbi:hypothetical protein [Comamonas thiooxydans]|uniref:hypothetical protein n=1 Tax=Comamonas thiooxydans TaxID=363952 RepID=UPI001CCA2CAE|nr:hypothetical protein [Comamonas thiooxydans]UBQ44588.1 hypothetical protein LCH15_26225 [Comamonas thiooxydans]
MSTHQPTDDELRHLTPEERAALAEDYDEDADNEAAAAAAANAGGAGNGAAEDDEAPAAAGAAQAPAAAPAAAQAPAAAAAPAAGGAAQDDGQGAATTDAPAAPAPAPAASRAPAYVVELPADFAEQQAANKQARAELKAKLNSGDLDMEEYEAEAERLDEERMSLMAQKQRAEISKEMTEQAAQNDWKAAINSFMDDASKNGEIGLIDYRKDEDKARDFDSMVKGLATANPDKPLEWYLYEAHKRVVALHEIPVVAKTSKKEQGRKPPVDTITPNLAHMPGGSGDGDAFADEFAAIDKLTGLAAERAVAALSPQKLALYLERD